MASKREIWLCHYLDQSDPKTYLNAAESARAAGYKCAKDNFKKIGYVNRRECEKQINDWLDDAGLSESVLKLKLVSLLDAKETKFFQKDGLVKTAVEVENLGVQQKALDMAMKMKGMYAPEKKKVSFEDDEGKQAVVGFFAKVMGVDDDPAGD
ncbi:hypothetical protein [Maridesulfovibrio sp.]|uniref:hypothetical protein n=1 Tax=Maridesulfovibrio sp. TaxID=2795000 RepID=UPI0029CA6437|nr:hypothetical protein [Maridesulfovibrio sp.]